MSWSKRLANLSWILLFLWVCGQFAYERFAPCGLHAMKINTILWIHRCSTIDRGTEP